MSADFETVIVGAGFAGLSVASQLPEDTRVVLDRGEPFDLDAIRARFRPQARQHQPGHYDSMIDAEARAYSSELNGNRPEMPFSVMSSNAYSFVQGGISNWWGGFSARVTDETFRMEGVLSWPYGLDELQPYYAEAERIMRVHGDPTAPDHKVYAPMPGWDYWRGYFADLFPLAHVTPEAKNITDRDSAPMGQCEGYGHCAICEKDAKARPGTVFPHIDALGRTKVKEVVFEGSRASALLCETDGEETLLHFDRLVLAAGGMENVALLARSQLPIDVPRSIGRRYQDHTTCEVMAVLPKRFDRYRLGAEGAIEIPELSGYFDGIEVKTVMLTSDLRRNQIEQLGSGASLSAVQLMHRSSALDRTACFYLQMEVPPEWDLQVRCRGDRSFLYTMPYLAQVPRLDAVVLQVIQRMAAAGLIVEQVQPHHRHGFGGHHYSGATPMSRCDNAVVDPDQRLIGTDNVYLNGASVMPRCGGAGPTLSIVALGLRLGRKLAGLAPLR